MPDETRYDLRYGTAVPFEDSFLVVGGYDLDTIYKYEQETDTFELMESRLPYPVENPIAILVDVDIFPSCPSTTTAAFTTTTGYPTTTYPTTTYPPTTTRQPTTTSTTTVKR